MDRAHKESAEFVAPAEFEKFARVRQGRHGILRLLERGVKPLLQLRQGNLRRETLVKNRERQAELSAKLPECHLLASRLSESKIGGLPNRRQIIHQSPRPVENDVANHPRQASRQSRTRASTHLPPIPARGRVWTLPPFLLAVWQCPDCLSLSEGRDGRAAPSARLSAQSGEDGILHASRNPFCPLERGRGAPQRARVRERALWFPAHPRHSAPSQSVPD